jgi:hypothetical protein
VDRTLSWLAGAHNPDATERTLVEIDAAIAMVSLGIAATVRLVNMPAAEETAFDAAARAQAAGVAFSLQRQSAQSSTMIVGPRLGASFGDPA